MLKDKCFIVVKSITEDGTIEVVNGDTRADVIVKITNVDEETTTISMTKKEFNNIFKLVNKHL